MAELKDQLNEIGFGEVKAEYKGVTLKFKALNTEESLVFFSLFMRGNTAAFFTTHKDELIKYISHSTGKSQRWVTERSGSPGFMLFCVNKMLEASDYDYFILNSLELQDKMMALVKQLPTAKKEEVEQKIAEIEEKNEAGSKELSVPSASPQGEASSPSSGEEHSGKPLRSTRKYRRRKRRK